MLSAVGTVECTVALLPAFYFSLYPTMLPVCLILFFPLPKKGAFSCCKSGGALGFMGLEQLGSLLLPTQGSPSPLEAPRPHDSWNWACFSRVSALFAWAKVLKGFLQQNLLTQGLWGASVRGAAGNGN